MWKVVKKTVSMLLALVASVLRQFVPEKDLRHPTHRKLLAN